MNRQVYVVAASAIFLTSAASAQNDRAGSETVPIYQVTVIQRTVKAVDYQYRNGPTMVDFRGTVLLPKAKGEATVESKKGHTEIDARFEHIAAPTRYGREYLTYVLWAISPEGHPKNLGEVLANSHDRAKLHVTTDLQAFGMIVTAEPYSAVREPSDVVVMENMIRPDTVGHIEEISAKYELLPRGHYTYQMPSNLTATTPGEQVSMDRYEEIVEVYQAQNAVGIARAAGADRYAADTLAKAEQLLRDAQQFQARRADKSTIVTAARHAAQTAEDARAIAIKRKQEADLSAAREQLQHEQERRAQAEAAAQRARAQMSADRMQLDEERNARQQAEIQAEAARAMPPQPPPQPQVVQTAPAAAEKSESRMRMLRELTAVTNTMDTPRGLVVLVGNDDFRGADLSPACYSNLARVAAIIAAHPGVYVQVDGHTDSTGAQSRDEQVSYEHAIAVRNALVRDGVPAAAISARGVGGARPVASNATAAGRAQNRRVEITISGEPIGTTAYWDRSYSVVPR
jgi:outer membrane protein OmpA-like peptidoglycan-associated protein